MASVVREGGGGEDESRFIVSLLRRETFHQPPFLLRLFSCRVLLDEGFIHMQAHPARRPETLFPSSWYGIDSSFVLTLIYGA